MTKNKPATSKKKTTQSAARDSRLTAAPAKSADAAPRRPNHTVRAVTLKRPNLPYETAAGEPTFKIIYVDEGGGAHHVVSTRKVWKQIMEGKLYAEVKSDFLLSVSPGGIVEAVSSQPKPMAMPGFEQEGADNPAHLVVEMNSEGGCVARQVPNRMPAAIVDEAIGLLSAGEKVSRGQTLGRCKVAKVTNESGKQVVALSFR